MVKKKSLSLKSIYFAIFLFHFHPNVITRLIYLGRGREVENSFMKGRSRKMSTAGLLYNC